MFRPILFTVLLLQVVIAQLQQLRCINFYGLETERARPVCDWRHPPVYYLEVLKTEWQINTVRIPFSYDYVKRGNWIELDQMMNISKSMSINPILDFHRVKDTHQAASPISELSLKEFLWTWFQVLDRYKDSVWGVGIFNEIQTDDVNFTIQIQINITNALEAKYPDKYRYFVGCHSYGSNCKGMEGYMHLTLNTTWNRTWIDIHRYQFQMNQGMWETSIPTSIPADHYFVGEIGWRQEIPHQKEWAVKFLEYLEKRGVTSACAWTIAISGDTGGFFNDDCNTFDSNKSDIFKSLWADNNTTSKDVQLYFQRGAPKKNRYYDQGPFQRDQSSLSPKPCGSLRGRSFEGCSTAIDHLP